MEQGRKAKGVVLAEECVVAGLVAAIEEEVSVQDLVEIASAPVVVNEECIKWGFPAMSRNAQSAARP